jgi:ABC-type lipoprotein release transport system permease subunit
LLLVPLQFAAMAAGMPQLAMLPAPTYSVATLGGALLIALMVAVLSAVLPALRIRRLDAAAALTGSAEAAPASMAAGGGRQSAALANASTAPTDPGIVHFGNVPGLLRQIAVVTRIGFATLPQRARSVLLITAGMACTTFVLVWVLSMAHAIRSRILDSGDPANVVLRSSSTAWLHDSRLPEGVVDIAARAPSVARAADGSPLAEPLLYANIGLTRRSGVRSGPVEIVGVGSHWREMMPSFHLVSGRLPKPGTNEVMVGELARRASTNLDGGVFTGTMHINGKLLRGVEWQVVGTFTAGNWWDGYLVADIDALRRHSNGLWATAALVRLESPRSFGEFRSDVSRMLPSSLQVERETEAYAALWRSVPKALLSIAFVLICLLAIGTTMATMMVAHAALEARRREIATLRVLGFDNRAAAVSILVEALPFALLGAWIAAGIVWWLRDGALQVGAWSVIEVKVDLYLILIATGCAAGIAMLGTLPLALKTLRRRALDGLQDLRELDAVTVARVRAAFGRRQVTLRPPGAAPAHLTFAGNTSGR